MGIAYKTLKALFLLGVGIYVGSSLSCKNKHDRYGIRYDKGNYFVCESITGEKQPITTDFQMGSLEYRLEGIKEEGRESVKYAINKLSRFYDD